MHFTDRGEHYLSLEHYMNESGDEIRIIVLYMEILNSIRIQFGNESRIGFQCWKWD